MEVVLDNLHITEELELVLDLYEVVTRPGVDTPRDLNGNRDEIVDNLLEDISDTAVLRVGLDGWVEDDGPLAVVKVLEVDSDLKDWWVTVNGVVSDVDLVCKVSH